MAELSGSRTEQNLMKALVSESVASLRYQYFAQQADVEGQPEAAKLFRSVAEGEAGHGFGHLEFLAEIDDADLGAPLDGARDHLRAAAANEEREAGEMYPEMARVARDEGLDEIADWMEALARAEAGHARRLIEGLDQLRSG